MRTDVVIVGSGLAGLTAALHAATNGLHVTVVTKSMLGGSTPMAQGGVAVALASEDDPALHARDTLVAGAGLSREEVVGVLTREGPSRILELIGRGAHFDLDDQGNLALGQEAAHSRRRILHASGDATGAELMRASLEAVRRHPRIHLREGVFVCELLVNDGQVMGVAAPGEALVASATVLATGGVGRLYRYTTNARESTGDGIAMAARAGARLQDMEFVQFHPTALDAGGDPLSLITEAVRGEGGWLVNGAGQRFMLELHPDAELAPRDVVARGIWAELSRGQRVYLDARKLGHRFARRFPTVARLCAEHGLKPETDLLPVVPAAHYFMGGIAVDARGRSSLPGLWACGEACSSGLHGANRLASNSLLEALVFGARVGDDVAQAPPVRPLAVPALRRAEADPALEARLRELMWRHVGLVRQEAGLALAQRELEELALPPGSSEVCNMREVACLIAASARARCESRGAHYRSDLPDSEESWSHRRVVVEQGRVEVREEAARCAS